VVRHIFKLARCGYALRVTSQASYSPEYITPTQKNHDQYEIFYNLWLTNTLFYKIFRFIHINLNILSIYLLLLDS
jgi:hypothetical protein